MGRFHVGTPALTLKSLGCPSGELALPDASLAMLWNAGHPKPHPAFYPAHSRYFRLLHRFSTGVYRFASRAWRTAHTGVIRLAVLTCVSETDYQSANE